MAARLLISLIMAYRKYGRIIFPASCRFSPSCSEYAQQALRKYGFWQGIAKTAKRLKDCHPLSGKSGYDPLL